MTRRLRLDLAYDGTDFAGWQVQPGQRTVQGTLEAALARLSGDRPVAVRGAGRTDSGVHARRQTADLDYPGALSDVELFQALTRLLPADVRPVTVATAPPDFSARRSARRKIYEYHLDRSPGGDPFLARHALHHPHRMDVAAVQDGLARLPGRHDWSGFTASICEIENRVRTLSAATFTDGRVAVFRLQADGFLTYMARNIVGTLLEIARGRFEPARIDRILVEGRRDEAGPTAPAHGLRLHSVEYPGDPGIDAVKDDADGRVRRGGGREAGDSG